MWLMLKLIQFWNHNTSIYISNSIFDFIIFILYLIGFVYALKISFNLVKQKKIKKISTIIIHIILLLGFTLASFSIIFKNPDSNNYLVYSPTQEEIWDNQSGFTNWFNAFYFSTNTLVGGGYSDIIPIGFSFRLLSMFEMIIGWLIFITFFAEMISYLNK